MWAAAALAALLAVPVLAISDPTAPTVSAAASCSGPTYTVVSGDSWSLIARKVGVTMTSLLTANNATTSTVIHPGQILCVPSGTTTTTVPATTTPTTAAPTSTTVALPSGVVVIRQFPVQGLCWFTDSWGAPRSGGRTHEGVDIIATRGKYIYAADDGVLTKQYIDTPGALAGNGWRLTRADGTYFFYAHLDAFAPGLKVGSAVKAGQILGVVGQTGAAGTPHLHFEVHPGGGAPVNPTSIVRAVDGCTTLTVPPQPTDTPPTTAPSTTTPVTTPSTTVPPTTTVPAPSPALGNGLWQFISPITALDTQAPSGERLAAGVTRTLTVSGLSADVTGAMVRVVVRNAERNGNLVVHRCGAVPTAATLNFGTDRLNATMSMVGVSNRTLCITASAAVDVRLDVMAVVDPLGVGLEPVPSTRVIDTRESSPLVPGDPMVLAPRALGAARGSRAVTASITVLSPSGAGSLAIGPCGGTPWIVPYSASGHQLFGGVFRINDLGLCISSTTEVQVIVDVTGVWQGTQPVGVAGPMRLLDSRTSGAITSTTRQVTLTLPTGATRAQVTVAVLPGATNGALFVWNCADAKPIGSAVSTGGSVTSATLSLDVTGGLMCVASTGNVHAIVDLTAIG